MDFGPGLENEDSTKSKSEPLPPTKAVHQLTYAYASLGSKFEVDFSVFLLEVNSQRSMLS